MNKHDVEHYERYQGNDIEVFLCDYCSGDIYNYGGEWITCNKDESPTCAKSPTGFHAHSFSWEHVMTKDDVERQNAYIRTLPFIDGSAHHD